MATAAAPAAKKDKKFQGVVVVNRENCKGCGFCVEFCPLHALELEKGYNAKGYHPPFLAKPEKCNGCDMCGLCVAAWPTRALPLTDYFELSFTSREEAVWSKEQLLEHLCTFDDDVSPNAIEVYVHRLRKKLEPARVKIVTVRGLGYYLAK